MERPVWFVISGLGSEWLGMGRDLLELKPFYESLSESSVILEKRLGVNLMEKLKHPDPEDIKNLGFIGGSLCALQVNNMLTLAFCRLHSGSFLFRVSGNQTSDPHRPYVCLQFYTDQINTQTQ